MILIVERLAHVVSGHEHTQLAAIRAMVPDTEVRLIGSKPDSFAEESATAILSTRRDARKKADQSLANDVKVLSNLLAEQGGSSVVLVFPSANAFEVRLVLNLLDRPKRFARYCLRMLRPEDVVSLSQDERSRLRRAISKGQISLHTETGELKAHLAETYQLEAEDNFLLPCSIEPGAAPETRDRDSKDAFRVGFLGAPRKDKGARMVPAILREVARLKASDGRDIRFNFQRPRISGLKLSPRLYSFACGRAVQGANGVDIDWMKTSLSDEEFCDAIVSQDLLLVPYSPDFYAYRGSGIIVDGVLAGVPILHSKGIGMSHFLQDTAFSASDASEFAKAIIELSVASPLSADNFAAARRAVISELERTRGLFSELSKWCA